MSSTLAANVFSHSSGRTKYILNDRLSELCPCFTSFSVLCLPLTLPPSLPSSLPPSLPPPASVTLSLLCATAHVHTRPLRTALFAQRRCEELSTQPLPLSSIQFQSRLQSRRQQTLFRHDFRPVTGTPAFLNPHRALHSFYFIFW